MTRPTPVQLNSALAAAEQSRPPHYVTVLAAEVRALHAALFRVEALCSMNHDDSLIRAGDIRAALRGSTP